MSVRSLVLLRKLFGSSKSGNALLLVGLAEAGKTVLFTKLIFQKNIFSKNIGGRLS